MALKRPISRILPGRSPHADDPLPGLRHRTARSIGSSASLVAALCACVWSAPSPAQRAIVTSASLSVTREISRIYLQSVDFATGMALPGPEIATGDAVRGTLLPDPSSSTAFLTTARRIRADPEPATGRSIEISAFATASFRRTGSLRLEETDDAFALVLPPTTLDPEPRIGVLRTLRNSGKDWRGVLETRSFTMEMGGTRFGPADRWELPGAPVAAVCMKEVGALERIVALCRGPIGTSAILAIVHTRESDTAAAACYVAPDENGYATTPAGIAASRDGRYCFVLTTGYALDRPSGEPASWLHVFDANDFTEASAPLELPGTARPEDAPVKPSEGASCWVATRSTGAEFAYATRAALLENRLTKAAFVPLSDVSKPIRLAPAPEGIAVAVAVDRRLEVWTDDRRGERTHVYEDALGALQWTHEGLFIGEAGRTRLINPDTLESYACLQLQSGWVVDIAPIPRDAVPTPDPDADGLVDAIELQIGTDPARPDTDADGLPDGVDPEPRTPSPRLQLPSRMTFPGDTVGQEVKAFIVDSANPNAPGVADRRDYVWQLDYDKTRMPWLAVHPMSGRLGDMIVLGVLPNRYPIGETVSGDFKIDLANKASGIQAAGSPATLEVRVTAETSPEVRRILWITGTPGKTSLRDTDDPRNLRSLAALLAAPPNFFSHHEASGAFQEPLDGYSIVVLDPAAAIQGAITRQVLLDYVIRGGSLLLIGGYCPDETARNILSWLAPLGVYVDPAARVDGVFPATSGQWLARHWGSFQIADGCALHATDPDCILAKGGPVAPASLPMKEAAPFVFGARTYGRGRIALLAGATPLQVPAMNRQTNREFAKDLFSWLAHGAWLAELQDADSDGLPDNVEDRGGAGSVNPGETDYLDPDTDRDGLLDGLEDANLNGVVDEGETSPLNPDSDGDGVFDGADPTPLPPFGAPSVASVTPSEGPAEGGQLVLVSGRDFAPGATVLFDQRPTRSVQALASNHLLVEVPPCRVPTGGHVPVTVVNESEALRGVLPGGFRYTPLSRVTLALDAPKLVAQSDGQYRGEVSVRLETPPGVAPEKVLFVIKASPEQNFAWRPDPAGRQESDPLRPVVLRPTHGGGLLVVALSTKRGAGVSGSLATAPWETTGTAEPAATVRFEIESPRAIAANGQSLDIVAESAVTTLKPLR